MFDKFKEETKSILIESNRIKQDINDQFCKELETMKIKQREIKHMKNLISMMGSRFPR